MARYRVEIHDSYALGYVFGAFLGDGDALLARSRNSELGRIAWTFGSAEAETAEKLAEAVEVVTGVCPKIENTEAASRAARTRIAILLKI